MICRADSAAPRRETPRLDPPAGVAERSTAYGRPFWLAYAANTLIMVAVSLLFRYADFISLLGGTEYHLGWIVGVGMVGSLAMRLFLGVGIDNYGPRLVWHGSLILFAAACFGHLLVSTHTGPVIYLLRIVLCCSMAGIFGASMTYISGRAAPQRMAEMIGMLGTSGFVGMVIGTQLGDVLLGTFTIIPEQTTMMFVVAGLLACESLLFAVLSTWGAVHVIHENRPPLLQVLRRYNPGLVFIVGIAMGIGLSLPGTFVRTYAAELDLPRIGAFFGVYAPTAIITRILTRRLPERIGTKPMILAGLAAMVVSQLLFLPVRAEWQFVLPGIGYGLSHAVLFPSVIAAGSQYFPTHHRGLATTVMLSTWDLGALVGSPLVGAIVHFSPRAGLPPYPTMFLSVAGLLSVVGLVFLVRGRPHPPALEELGGLHAASLPRSQQEPMLAAEAEG